jgi:alpha-tubulin suppressor-like RCC1 family protein
MSEYNVKVVDCGAESTFVVTMEGDLFAFGLNRNGQFGNGVVHKDTIFTPY